MLKILMQIMSKSVVIATSKLYFTVFYMRDFKKEKSQVPFTNRPAIQHV